MRKVCWWLALWSVLDSSSLPHPGSHCCCCCPSIYSALVISLGFFSFSFSVSFLRCTQYWLFALSFGFFGFVTGCEVGCTSPLLVKLLGLYCLTQAFAIMTALRGIAALVGPPTAGILVDKFQDPGLALLLCGALMVSATIIASIAALLNKVMERREGYVQL